MAIDGALPPGLNMHSVTLYVYFCLLITVHVTIVSLTDAPFPLES